MGPHIHSEGYPSTCQCTYLLQNFSNNTHACRTSEVSTFRHILNCLHCLMRHKHKLVYVYEEFPLAPLVLADQGHTWHCSLLRAHCLGPCVTRCLSTGIPTVCTAAWTAARLSLEDTG